MMMGHLMMPVIWLGLLLLIQREQVMWQDTSYPSAGEGDGQDLDQRMTRVEDTLDELIGGYASDLGDA